MTLLYSPGGIGAANSDEAFAAQRQGATARYAVVRASVEQVEPLPRGYQASVHVYGQATGTALLSSEQFAYGGDGSIRGFQMFAATRDSGVALSAELRAPGIRVIRRLRSRGLADRLSVFAFTDYGAGGNDVHGSRLRLANAGPGLRYQVGRYVSVQAAYGRVVSHEGVATAGDGRAHFQLQTTF